MAILEGTTSVEQLRVARCPYPECGGIRPYFRHPDTNKPIAIRDSDIREDTLRDRYAINAFAEDIAPENVTVTRTKTLINIGQENERYKLEDNFTVSGASWTVDEFVDFRVRLDFPSPTEAPVRRKATRFVLSNTADTIILSKPLPTKFTDTLADVNVFIFRDTAESPKDKAKRAWDNYVFVCPECGKLFYVDKP